MQFEFNLKGKNWFGLYFLALLLYAAPLIGMQFIVKAMQVDPKNTAANLPLLFALLSCYGVLFLSIFILFTPICRKFLTHTYLDNKPFAYSGKIVSFVLTNIGNALLSIITLGIYFPWYMANIYGHVLRHTGYNDGKLGFRGKGSHLLGLAVLTMLLPMIVWIALMMHFLKEFQAHPVLLVVWYFFLYVSMIPYCYFVYKWAVHFSYKDFIIKWDTDAIPAMMTIFTQFILSVITLGIYWPVAFAKLYEYFVNRTVLIKNDRTVYILNADLDYGKTWRVTWGQTLLILVTCGIYGAWAACRLAGIYINNTSITVAE
jgi:uncharacterized membrane protein YjgN (DUF898 family)